jgi:phenylacetate-CoA ligase
MPSPAGLARRIYDLTPRSLRRVVSVVPFGWRVGSTYRSTLRFLLESDHWNRERLRAYQTGALEGILSVALKRVPAYRDRYGRLLGQDPWRILAEIEPFEKHDVQADPERFRDRSVPDRRTYVTSTGGTSGRPVRIVLDRRGFQIEWAFMMAQWMRAGYRPGDRRATFRGVPFPGGRLWQENPVYDEIQFSPFAMTSETLPAYVERIRLERLAFLYGYPSALTILARFVRDHPDCGFPSVRGLLCGSENVRPGQREFLEKTFRARFFSWYGQSEKVILAGECETSTDYHAFPQYGVTEILDARGQPTREPGAEGELVGTGFLNRAMPLIRYRTGDHATLLDDRCPSCGREFPRLGPVRGRWVQEMVVGRTGAEISLTALNMHGEVFDGVERFQFHQRQKGRVTLRIVPARPLIGETRQRILRALSAKTGAEIEWVIEETASLPLSPRGKGIFLVQEIAEVGSD